VKSSGTYAIIAGFCIFCPVYKAASQEAPAAAEITNNSIPSLVALSAQALSAKTGIPLSITLSDLITKGARVNFQSGLAEATPQPAPATTREDRGGHWVSVSNPELHPRYFFTTAEVQGSLIAPNSPRLTSSPEVEAARAKGYEVRSIDLDSRYLQNVLRMTGTIQQNATDVSRSISLEQPTPANARLLDSTNARIYEGTPIDPENDPFMESVAITGNNKLCSGTLIAANLVITAAHCYCAGVTKEVLFGTSIISPVSRIPVDEGASESLTPCDKLEKDLSSGDVAVLKLNQSVSYTPRTISSLQDIKLAGSVRAVGFGRSSAGSIGVKYQVNIVVASPQCDGIGPVGIPDQQVYRCRPTYELVAAGLNRDTCGGDSGGPIYVFGQDTKLYLGGTTSRSVDPTGRCGPGGIYEVLSDPAIRTWLENKGAKFGQ
jgi:hypothetical protein